MNPIIFIDNIFELKGIEKLHPELKDSPLVLISDSFSEKNLRSFNNRGYYSSQLCYSIHSGRSKKEHN